MNLLTNMWHLLSDFRFLRESEDEERDGWQAGQLIASRYASVLLRRPGPEDELGRCSYHRWTLWCSSAFQPRRCFSF